MRMSWIAAVVVALSFGCGKAEDNAAPKLAPETKPGEKTAPAATTEPAKPPPPAAKPEGESTMAAVVMHKVADFDAWKKVFDEHQPERQAAGVLGHHLNRDADDPNTVTIYMPISDVDKFKAFGESDTLKQAMQKAGVEGPPKIMLLKPVIGEAILDKPLAGMIVMHEVEDFDKWRTVYEGFDETRKKMGIIGHAVNQAADNPNMVVVYHQAESVDTLKKFAASDELKQAMMKAGVKGKPEITFHQGLPSVKY